MNSYALFMTRWTMQKVCFQGYKCATKIISRLGQLPIILIGVVTHGHEDERYAQYFNELWPYNPKQSQFHNWVLVMTLANFGGSPNFRVESVVWTLFAEFILCTYVALHMRIRHPGSNYWSKAFTKKFVASNG